MMRIRRCTSTIPLYFTSFDRPLELGNWRISKKRRKISLACFRPCDFLPPLLIVISKRVHSAWWFFILISIVTWFHRSLPNYKTSHPTTHFQMRLASPCLLAIPLSSSMIVALQSFPQLLVQRREEKDGFCFPVSCCLTELGTYRRAGLFLRRRLSLSYFSTWTTHYCHHKSKALKGGVDRSGIVSRYDVKRYRLASRQ